MSLPPVQIHSLYWSNIDPRIVDGQRKVFSHFGIPLVQHHRPGVMHGDWMDELISSAPEDAVLLFADIDSFPTDRRALEWMLQIVASNAIAGVAQCSNHLASKRSIYASPVFLGFQKKTWMELGCPSMRPTSEYDVAQSLTVRAEASNVDVDRSYPYACVQSKWPLAHRGVFGIGTFYDRGYFHLFQSRFRANVDLFDAVAQDVTQGQPLDFERYLAILAPRKRSFSFLFR
jgi:hypothetical protein